MDATAEQFRAIRDEAWKRSHLDAMECRACEDLIARVQNLWDKDRTYFSSAVPGCHDRETTRAIASALRSAETAMTVVIQRALASVARGYSVDGLNGLLAILQEARLLLAMPISRRFAERDPDGRSASEFASLLVHRARFQDGRPVITQELAAELPCPYEPEAEATI